MREKHTREKGKEFIERKNLRLFLVRDRKARSWNHSVRSGLKG
jgi:hypothetical protein